MEIGSLAGVDFALWVAHGWSHSRLARVHAKLDAITQQFDGLREYPYEIDAQFGEGRALTSAMYESLDGHAFALSAFDYVKLIEEKKRRGLPTPDTPLYRGA
jgi:hypothetical protein